MCDFDVVRVIEFELSILEEDLKNATNPVDIERINVRIQECREQLKEAKSLII